MDYLHPGNIKNAACMNYVLALRMPREDTTLYALEHPEYDTEEDFGHIMEAWVQNRSWWSREQQEAGRQEYLPRPKRRPGRPRTAEALAQKEAKEAARAEKARLLEEQKADKARRAEERRSEKERDREARAQRLKDRASSSGAIVITLKIPERTLAGIMQIKGELSMAECVVQLLDHALGPLATSPQPVNEQ